MFAHELKLFITDLDCAALQQIRVAGARNGEPFTGYETNLQV